MQLPQIKTIQDNISVIGEFGGVNKNYRIGDGEFADMLNMTNDYAPIIGTRPRRAMLGKVLKPQGMIGGEEVWHINNNVLYKDTIPTKVTLTSHIDEQRQLVLWGANLFIFPDNIVYNTVTEEKKVIDAEADSPADAKITLCKLDGTAYNSQNTVISDTEPSHDVYWIDTSDEDVVMKMYSTNSNAWVSVATTYVRIPITNANKKFSKYDAVTLSGVDDIGYNGYNFNQSNIVYKVSSKYIIVVGLLRELVHTNSQIIHAERKMPKLDFVCEHNNRLFGCRSGDDGNGGYVNEIYACKLGDPTNWEYFGGLDSDSYRATVGSQGKFTGCISYGGSVLFFKEDGYHKLYGNKPSNFEIVWKAGRGVQNGSANSITLIGEYLAYKAKDAVCLYDGSVNIISKNLGSQPLYEAVGCGYRDKYYLSMRDKDYHYKLYVYDITKGTWAIEDGKKFYEMAYGNNGLYMVDQNNDLMVVNNEIIYRKIFPMDYRNEPSPEYNEDKDDDDKLSYIYPCQKFYPTNIINGELEDTFEWFFETGDIDLATPAHKYVKRLNIRMFLNTDAKVRIEIMYDSSGDWNNVIEYYCTRKKSFSIPIPVERCDHMKLRFSGFGEFKMFSIAKAIEEGSGQ